MNLKDKSFNRRSFVKGSAAVMGGLMVNPLSIDKAAFAAARGEIKVALVGCGGRGTGAAVQALSTKEDVKLVAMADAFRDRLDSSYKNIAEKISSSEKVDVPDSRKYVGFDAYKQAIDEADVVILATPPGFRPMHFDYAIENGKHVFMEKPLATDAPGVRQVLETAEKAKQKKLNVVVGLQRHYQTVYREMMKRIHDGEIGDVVAAQAYWNGGGVWVRERQPQWNEMEYQMRNWYYFNWLCGDHITEQHIHNIDVINWAKNAYPVSAQGMGGREVRTGREHGEIFDHHYVEFTYDDGSIMNSQCRHIKGCWNKVGEHMQGTKGRADSSGTIYDLKGNVVWKHRDKDDPNPYQQEHDELFSAIAKGDYKFADAENGAKSTMTSLLGRMCTYSGQKISWDEALNSNVSLMPERFAWDATPPVLPQEDGFYPVPVPGETKVL
ncbi:MAG: Gfo/Idh/MocA family protein [Candidatus Cyclobacteriaceae bacterium M3_2C_046]